MQVQFLSESVYMNLSMLVSFLLFIFLSFLFFTFIFSLFRKRNQLPMGEEPELSVLIPAYNEEGNIGSCLESIKDSDYPASKLQIIVIDDASTDGTCAEVEQFKRKNKGLDITLLRGEHKGKSEALNLGLKHSRNELVMSIDADIVLEKDTMRKLAAPLQEENVAASNAVARIREPKSMLEHFQMIEFCLNNLIRTSFSRTFKNSIWFFGAVACYKKSMLDEVGGFKTDTLTEDMDICLEMYNKDYNIVTVEDAVMSTKAMPGIRELFRQRMRWYFGALQSLTKNRKLFFGRRSPPVVFLFVNQFWWTFFAFVFFPMTAIQFAYWWPEGSVEAASYTFRWFSVAGPFYVLYKMPEWGLNLLNIFGVLSGIVTLVMSIAALKMFRGRVHWKTLVGLFFYFPYTIIQDAIIVSGVFKYAFVKRRYFIA